MKPVNPTFTTEELHAKIDYDPVTGIFRHKRSDDRPMNGKPLGRAGPLGYQRVCVLGKHVYGHRLAWFHVHGVWPNGEIDHINRNKQDNRIENLRVVSRAENAVNRDAWGSIPLTGVKLSRNSTYIASIVVNKKFKYLGTFKTAEKAHNAYLAAAKDRQENIYDKQDERARCEMHQLPVRGNLRD